MDVYTALYPHLIKHKGFSLFWLPLLPEQFILETEIVEAIYYNYATENIMLHKELGFRLTDS